MPNQSSKGEGGARNRFADRSLAARARRMVLRVIQLFPERVQVVLVRLWWARRTGERFRDVPRYMIFCPPVNMVTKRDLERARELADEHGW